MKTQFPGSNPMLQPLRPAMVAALLLALGVTLPGCATSASNRAARTDSMPQPLVALEWNGSAPAQTPPSLWLVSIGF